jgi:arylsulfatase A-like enzyme
VSSLRLLSALLLAGAVACTPGPSDPAARPNLLLITVDTLRRDHLQPYGAARPTSPNLARLAASSVVFDDAQTHAPWTLPSLATLLTGLPTSAHGCRSFHDALAPSYQTLPEQLLAHGYDTAAVSSHVFLGRPYGLHQGFVHFDDELVLEMTRSDEVISSPAVSDKGIEFLRAQAGGDERPWMLWLHYFDPHAVYQAHPDQVGTFGDQRPIDLYDGEIAFTDHHIGRVLDALEALGFDEDTVVVLTSDHGEEFGDHGGAEHGHSLYHELIDAPLLVRAPGLEPRRVHTTVPLAAVPATLLELLDLPPLVEAQSPSLVPLMRGEELELGPVLLELDRNPRLSKVGLVDGTTKYVLDRTTGTAELFDRTTDRLEQRDLAPQSAARLAALQAELETLLERAAAVAEDHPDAFRQALGADQLEDLAGTGYVGDE